MNIELSLPVGTRVSTTIDTVVYYGEITNNNFLPDYYAVNIDGISGIKLIPKCKVIEVKL